MLSSEKKYHVIFPFDAEWNESFGTRPEVEKYIREQMEQDGEDIDDDVLESIIVLEGKLHYLSFNVVHTRSIDIEWDE